MTSDKGNQLKRLIIFIFIAFAPLIIVTPILNKAMHGLIFDGELADSPVTHLYGLLAMLWPAAANIITRIITKEGFHETYLRANFKGNMKYYVLAVIIPVFYTLISAAAGMIIIGRADFSLTPVKAASIIITNTVMSIAMSFMGLGEELGWRGYMMPKLEKLIGVPLSVITGGIIWGLWHAPLTCSGHNFGTDYKGFPYVGIALMCIICITSGCILTYLTKRTKSVYPAAILHTINNNISAAMFFRTNGADDYLVFCIMNIPVFLFAVTAFILMLHDKNRKRIET